MTTSTAELLAGLLLVCCLGVAVRRPRGLPEAFVAVPAAVLLTATGAVSAAAVRDELARLWPVVLFLAAILALAHLADVEGVFRALGSRLARAAGGGAPRLLLATSLAAAVVTAVLSLDATVVLLTPVVLEAAWAAELPVEPAAVVTGQLANSGSLLLPVSNLTNLLAVAQTGISFERFAALMALPWLLAVATAHVVVRALGHADLRSRGARGAGVAVPIPWRAVAVLAAVLAGFVSCSLAGVSPAFAAGLGCLALAVPALRARRTSLRAVAAATAPGFCLFVLGLAVVVRALSDNGLGHLVGRIVPTHGGWAALLLTAVVAAALANVLNNLPACLLLLPVVAGSLPLVLAVLIGVNVGPNLTPIGSLATLLWHRSLPERGAAVGWWRFVRVGLVATPVALVLATTGLWAALMI